MIRIASFCQTSTSLPSFSPAARQQTGPLDILCCRIRQQEAQHARGCLQSLAASLQMTCSSTLLAGHGKGGQGETVLSIFTGTGTWVLNSGSIALTFAAQEKERVQFALVRKEAAAVLVIHIHHDAPRRKRLDLMRALLSHQLVKGQQYSAVILCMQRHLRLSRSKAAQLMAGSGFVLHSNLQPETGGAGAMFLCVPLESGLAGLELGRQEHCTLTQCPPEDAEAEPAALVCEFQVHGKASHARKKPHYPLSFAEQWAGYKEHFRPNAL